MRERAQARDSTIRANPDHRTRGLQLNALRDYYPGALAAFDELGHPDALAVLAVAPDPERGRRLLTAQIAAALRRGGRQRA